ncbi:MAG: hypothetical protein COB15_02785 [Flavobacteriales bacterium]|nr:MAG: hypothetical protein COB15_02785 [Flavobacteriales bacterium]
MKRILLSIITITAFGFGAKAQWSQITPSDFVAVYSSSIAFADIDGDNDQDVLITGNSASNQKLSKLYTNDGTGSFSEVLGTTFVGVFKSSIAFADIDGDNDQDVLITGWNSSFQSIAKLYTNDGSGIFTEVIGTPFDGVNTGSIAFADVDGDNDQDVLITGRNNSSTKVAKLYTNDGSGTFTEATGTPFEGVFGGSVAFADIDGDNDQDLLITGQNSTNQEISKLYSNNGSGSFSQIFGTTLDGVYQGSVAFSDIDGDNDQDVLITGENSLNLRIAKLYSNNGSGSFTEITGTTFDGVENGEISFADVDNDNDQDVLIAGINNSSLNVAKLYTNDGSGIFTELSGTPFIGGYIGSVAFADIDGDNDNDLLITGNNNGAVSFAYRNNTISLIGSITVQGQSGSSTITTNSGTLQMEAVVLPANATDTTYTWSVANGTGSATINTSGLLSALTNGTVTVTATANDASGITGSITITISNQSVSINNYIGNNKIAIYPNPVSSQLTLNTSEQIKSISILDITGKILKTVIPTNNTIDVSNFTQGIYFLQIQTEKGISNSKFIKE